MEATVECLILEEFSNMDKELTIEKERLKELMVESVALIEENYLVRNNEHKVIKENMYLQGKISRLKDIMRADEKAFT